MSGERIFGPRLLSADRLKSFKSVFERLWRVDETAAFGKLLRRIDQAFVQHRSHMRILRLNRMLERDYTV